MRKPWYPGTALFSKMEVAGRIITRDWDLYDTRHVVYQTNRLSAEELKAGYDWAYKEFYTWSSIAQASRNHATLKHCLKHFCYSAGWKKFEPAWDLVIQAKRLALMRPMLETVLAKVSGRNNGDDHAARRWAVPTLRA